MEQANTGQRRHRLHRERTTQRRHSASPPSMPSPPESKMDRYFAEGYDPMLDVSANTRTDERGLVEDDGWERMLGALNERDADRRARKEARRAAREARALERESRQRRREGRAKAKSDGHSSASRNRRRRRSRSPSDEDGNSGSETQTGARRAHRRKTTPPPPHVGASLLDITYSARGTSREWDRGKVTLE